MATVLIQHGEQGPDGTPPPRAYFQLIDGRLHIPTIRNYFRLANVALDGIVYPTDHDGFTFNTFSPDVALRATGDPLPALRPTKVFLVRTNEVYGEPDHPGGKRKVVQSEENLGLWTLPPTESQPRTLKELADAIRAFLQIDHNVSWLFKYRYHTEIVPIVSDSALAEAFDYFRLVTSQCADADDTAISQHCRLYLNTTSEEVAPRDLIRARITGILDAAAASSSGRESNGVPAAAAAAASSALPPPPLLPPPLHLALDNPASAMALLSSHLAAMAGYAPYHLPLQQHPAGENFQQDGAGMYGNAGGEGEGEDGEDGDQGDAGTMSGLLGYQRQSGSEGLGGDGGFANQGALKKESKTRHADGRFKNEVQHQRKMADMTRKISELFDGAIAQMVEVCDHKKIMCRVCNHACTAYSAYHTDCVRKHFLRHHEATLRDRGVDVGRWRKEYEVSQKVKRQIQMQEQPAPQVLPGVQVLPQNLTLSLGPQGQITLPANLLLSSLTQSMGMGGLNALGMLGLNGLGAVAAPTGGGSGGGGGSGSGSAGGEGDPAQRGLQAHLLSIAGFPVDLSVCLPVVAQQTPAAANTSAGSGPGAAGASTANTVTALLQQAQSVSADEHVQLQAAGALSSLLSAASNASSGQPQGTGVPSLASQLSAALTGNSGGGGAPLSLAPMARLASGTVTTEMPLPPPPPPLAPAQGVAGGGGESLLQEVTGLGMTRSNSVASQGPATRSPHVVTTDMSQPPV